MAPTATPAFTCSFRGGFSLSASSQRAAVWGFHVGLSIVCVMAVGCGHHPAGRAVSTLMFVR